MNEEDVGVITVLTFAMSLQLVVIKATNLPNAEKFGESDPYISIEFQGKLLYKYTIPGVKRAVYFIYYGQ